MTHRTDVPIYDHEDLEIERDTLKAECDRLRADLSAAVELLRVCGPANDAAEAATWHRVMRRIDPEYGASPRWPASDGEFWAGENSAVQASDAVGESSGVSVHDRGQLGRELAKVSKELGSRPTELQRSASIRGLEPARHSDKRPDQPMLPDNLIGITPAGTNRWLDSLSDLREGERAYVAVDYVLKMLADFVEQTFAKSEEEQQR